MVADGTVYFAASIWPFMGVFIHALDAETGKVIWTNDGDGSAYIKQPHSTDSFAGVAPQGPMSVSGDFLLIPGGRSVPAAYDRKTGKLRHFLLNDNSKKGGGHIVCIAGDVFFNGPGVFATSTGKYLGDCSSLMVHSDGIGYASQNNEVRVFDLRKSDLKSMRWKMETIGTAKLPGVTAIIKAGNHLYVGQKGRVAVIELPLASPLSEAELAWEEKLDGTPVSLVVADDRLFVSTKEGRIYCFGEKEHTPAETQGTPGAVEPFVASGSMSAAKILAATGVSEGYAVVWSADVPLLTDLIHGSKLQVIAIDADPVRVQKAREAMVAANFYGERIAVHSGSGRFSAPPYLASLMIAPEAKVESISRLYEAVRPYGGSLSFQSRKIAETSFDVPRPVASG